MLVRTPERGKVDDEEAEGENDAEIDQALIVEEPPPGPEQDHEGEEMQDRAGKDAREVERPGPLGEGEERQRAGDQQHVIGPGPVDVVARRRIAAREAPVEPVAAGQQGLGPKQVGVAVDADETAFQHRRGHGW